MQSIPDAINPNPGDCPVIIEFQTNLMRGWWPKFFEKDTGIW